MRNSWSTQDRPSQPGGTIVVTGAGGFDAEDGTRAGASMGRRRNARTCPWFELQFGTKLGREPINLPGGRLTKVSYAPIAIKICSAAR